MSASIELDGRKCRIETISVRKIDVLVLKLPPDTSPETQERMLAQWKRAVHGTPLEDVKTIATDAFDVIAIRRDRADAL